MSELYHHGIKGMKWGVRRFQYKNGRLTNVGKKRYSDDSVSQKPKTKKSNPGDSDMSDEEAEAARRAKIKRNLKVGAAIVGTGLAVYGGYKLSQVYTGSKQSVDPTTGFRLLDKDMSTQEHLNKINPGRIRLFSKTSKNKEIINGSSSNCMLCTTAYELRKRGYDVHAGYSETGYTPENLFTKIYKNYKGTTNTFLSTDDIINDPKNRNPETAAKLFNKLSETILKEGGSGSRGNVMVYWKNGLGGHSMIWENQDGKIKFMDGQTGREYTNFTRDILSHVRVDAPMSILRTDNLELNIPGLKEHINKDTVLKTYVDHGAEIVTNIATDERVIIATSAAGVAGYRGYNTIVNKRKQKEEVKNERRS